MNSRTTVSFHHDGDIWPVVDKWAGENGYRRKEPDSTGRTYQKGIGFLVAPMMLKVSMHNQETMIEAWIRTNVIVRLMALFIVPAEMGIESGGFRLVAPRSIARKAVNKLLAQLGQPLIP